MLNKRRLQVADQLKKIACTALAGASVLGYASCAGAETLKIAFIETLSGTFAPIGQNQLNTYRMFADIANKEKKAGAGNIIEVVGFDGKGSPQESLTQLKVAADQGFRYIAQGNGSGVALALIEAVNKHNERNPGKEIVFLNHSAIDPTLTNSKCSFWHFRFDANSDMKMEALTSYMAKDTSIKKIYLIGQNYAHGQQISRSAKEMIKRKRADIQIVGDDLHPTATVKDFSPYIAKIKASGADTVVTGNWGADLALLIKAAKDAGLTAKFYTYYASSSGVPTAISQPGNGMGAIKTVTYWHENNETYSGHDFAQKFRAIYNDDLYVVDIFTIIEMLSKAVKTTGSVDPIKVAYAMEGSHSRGLNGPVEMRALDHQLQQPLYIATWTKVDGKIVKYDQEKTGYGWKTDQKIDSYISMQPTSCDMKRPPKPAV
jgi:branched-chain amino acid transport system substrate-binding protein